ncbi:MULTISPECIES: hypothetical protein [Roseobacteraceae]|uniref:hypothetical protein n=1 Tax=Roseobacteraceae TaxID=2854170 RepID=UPI001C4700DF|nr:MULTISPECIES: hypothetical protein [Roseobacteraceae]MBV7408990.1 hypothetical protein [Maritimibacter sp. DP1N21-5]MBY5934323.1 hypothetical protein [Tateyamaria omphalii]
MLSTLTAFPLRIVLIAGLIGELAFEAYAWLMSPLIFGVVLEPSNLIAALARIYLDASLGYGAAFAVHFAIGVVGFGSAVWLIHRLSGLRPELAGALTGLALWFVAQGGLAQLVGRDFMMGFGAYTQSSFVGHVGMATIMGAVIARLQARHRAERTA